MFVLTIDWPDADHEGEEEFATVEAAHARVFEVRQMGWTTPEPSMCLTDSNGDELALEV